MYVDLPEHNLPGVCKIDIIGMFVPMLARELLKGLCLGPGKTYIDLLKHVQKLCPRTAFLQSVSIMN